MYGMNKFRSTSDPDAVKAKPKSSDGDSVVFSTLFLYTPHHLHYYMAEQRVTLSRRIERYCYFILLTTTNFPSATE